MFQLDRGQHLHLCLYAYAYKLQCANPAYVAAHKHHIRAVGQVQMQPHVLVHSFDSAAMAAPLMWCVSDM
jgi:hypothetical protein